MASTSATVSLNGASAVGAGSSADFSRAVARVTMVVIPTGAVTGGVVELEASQDNTNWVGMHITTPVQGDNVAVTATWAAFRYWRARISTAISGGGTVKATLMESDYNGGIL